MDDTQYAKPLATASENTPVPLALERRIVDLPNSHGRRYCVLGPKMAIDFHFNKLDGWDVTAGLECHYSECPSYMEGKEPFSEKCWLTGVRCWGDGTSLYATEYLYPLFAEMGVEDFWPVLEGEYYRRLRDVFGEAHESPRAVDAVAKGGEVL